MTTPEPQDSSAGGTDATDSSDDNEDSPLEDIVVGITIGLILTVAFGLLALGVPWFWVVFPIGFAGVLPAVLGLTKLYERRQAGQQKSGDSTTDQEDALGTLRERYARGELTDAEFEHRLERLLGTETLEDARREVRSRERGGERERERRHRRESGADPDRNPDVELEES